MSQQEDFTVPASTTEGYEVHAIFPIAVYTKENIIDPDDFPVLDMIKDTPMAKSLKTNLYGDKSENTYLLDQPAMDKLRAVIQQNIDEYANRVLGLAGKFAISQSWLSVKHPGQEHVTHSHANSIISGVFYFGNEAEVEGLTFSKNAYVASTWMMDPLLNPNISNQFSFTEITLKVENCMICLFPSYLAHKVTTNTSANDRYSIAFNVVPRYGLGLEGDLTDLEFRRVNREDI
jgi:uncharacterized protein (TIGR02466 family)